MAKMNATQINGQTKEQIAASLKAKGAKMIVPKGVSEPLVRFAARDHQFNDVAFGACLIEDFSYINAVLMKVD